MASEADIWKSYEDAAAALFVRLGKRLQGPEHPGMLYPEFLAELTRLEDATAGKLGKARDEVAQRFDADEVKLKGKCGV